MPWSDPVDIEFTPDEMRARGTAVLDELIAWITLDEARNYAANKDSFGACVAMAGATLGGGAAGGKK